MGLFKKKKKRNERDSTITDYQINDTSKNIDDKKCEISEIEIRDKVKLRDKNKSKKNPKDSRHSSSSNKGIQRHARPWSILSSRKHSNADDTLPKSTQIEIKDVHDDISTEHIDIAYESMHNKKVKLREKRTKKRNSGDRPISSISNASDRQHNARPWSFIDTFRWRNSMNSPEPSETLVEPLISSENSEISRETIKNEAPADFPKEADKPRPLVPNVILYNNSALETKPRTSTFSHRTAEHTAAYLNQQGRTREEKHFRLFKYFRRATIKTNSVPDEHLYKNFKPEEIIPTSHNNTSINSIEKENKEPIIHDSPKDIESVTPVMTLFKARSLDSPTYTPPANNEPSQTEETVDSANESNEVLWDYVANSISITEEYQVVRRNKQRHDRPMSAYVCANSRSSLYLDNTPPPNYTASRAMPSSMSSSSVQATLTEYVKLNAERQNKSYTSASVDNFALLDDDERSNALLGSKNNYLSVPKLDSTQDPRLKKRIFRDSVASFANFISPSKKLQRSSSVKETTRTEKIVVKPYRPTPLRKKERSSRLWSEIFDASKIDQSELRRQESIHELWRLETDFVEDLRIAIQTYRDSMVTLKLLSENDVNLIFRNIDSLLPLHIALVEKLEKARDENGFTSAVGHVFVDWFPQIAEPYREYCSKQSEAVGLLKSLINKDAKLKDFLERCFQSPFSMKRSLHSLLDAIRTRVLKYSLLLNNTLKRTNKVDVDEVANLQTAIQLTSEIATKIEESYADQQCQQAREKLDCVHNYQAYYVNKSKVLYLEAEIKNSRGNTVFGFVFDKAFVLTRPVNAKGDTIRYQLIQDPFPMRSLLFDEYIAEPEKSGPSDKVKYAFRIHEVKQGKSCTLYAADEYDKRKWVSAIKDAQKKFFENASFSSTWESQQRLSERRRATYDITQQTYVPTKPERGNSADTVHGLMSSVEDESKLILSEDNEETLKWATKTNTKEMKTEKSIKNSTRRKKFSNPLPLHNNFISDIYHRKVKRQPQRSMSVAAADSLNKTAQQKYLKFNGMCPSRSLSNSICNLSFSNSSRTTSRSSSNCSSRPLTPRARQRVLKSYSFNSASTACSSGASSSKMEITSDVETSNITDLEKCTESNNSAFNNNIINGKNNIPTLDCFVSRNCENEIKFPAGPAQLSMHAM